MPFCHNIFSIEINGLKSLFNRLSLQTIIFYNNDFGNYLDFCGIPLIFNMNMNGFMIIGIKEKSYSEYKKNCWHKK